jgi:hypothetical protein
MKRSQAANFGENRKRERAQELKGAVNQATILSVNADAAPNTFRVSLQWQGNHDISDFELQRLGKILMIQDETPNTGWAIIECSFTVPIAYSLPGSAIAEWRYALSPGEKIPLRPDLEGGINFGANQNHL